MTDFLSKLQKLGKKKRKRLGRGLGGGKGAKSGRGTTRHQKARGKIPLHFEGGQSRMVKRFPLLRGKGKNKPKRKKSVIIRLGDLEKVKGQIVDYPLLIKSGLLKEKKKNMDVKILASGTVKKKLIVRLPVSKKAQKLIEGAGGKVEVT